MIFVSFVNSFQNLVLVQTVQELANSVVLVCPNLMSTLYHLHFIVITLPPRECNPLSFDRWFVEYICKSCNDSPSLSTNDKRSLSVTKCPLQFGSGRQFEVSENTHLRHKIEKKKGKLTVEKKRKIVSVSTAFQFQSFEIPNFMHNIGIFYFSIIFTC